MIKHCERCGVQAPEAIGKPLRGRWFCNHCYRVIRNDVTKNQAYIEFVLVQKGLL